MSSQLQPVRSELKFEIGEGLAAEIKHYLGATLRRDAHSQGFGDSGYPVCSVYLDSPDALLCGQTIEGKRNRYKLRMRIYDDHPEHPAFAEIKRRDGQIVKKQRATVDRATASAILAGEREVFLPLEGTDAKAAKRFHKEWTALNEFCRLRDGIGAVGTTYVSYFRDAYVSPDGVDWRATFDRDLRACRYQLGQRITIPGEAIPATQQGLVIFELKFTNRFPRWMQELVRVFNLDAVSFPKYVNCRHALDSPAPRVPESSHAAPRESALRQSALGQAALGQADGSHQQDLVREDRLREERLAEKRLAEKRGREAREGKQRDLDEREQPVCLSALEAEASRGASRRDLK